MAELAALTLDDVTLRFRGLTILDGVSMEVAPGELLALIGPNGAGKTSVLNCISGIYRSTSGRILLGAQDLRGRHSYEIACLGVARTFQHGELFPDMTVLENVLVGRHAAVRTHLLAESLFLPGVRREEIRNREVVEEVLDFVELQRYRNKAVGSLPFGIQKIVGFARALAYEPKVLLLDEPCAGLNREDREDLARYIMRIQHEKHLAMIWVEHDMQMVADLADRICVLDYGQVLAQGEPMEVLGDVRVIEAYIGHSKPEEASLEVGREHEIQIRLLKAVKAVMSRSGDEVAALDIIAQLGSYSRMHFSSEELLMKLYGYPDAGIHAEEHAQMMESLDCMADSTRSGEHESARRMAAELERYLLEHIGVRDRAFSRFLESLRMAA